MTKYNTTQLNPDTCFERHVYHRDQFAHYLRWTHILKRAKIGMSILDFGCGSGNLLEVFYRNRFKPSKYIGLDIRKQTIKNNNIKWDNLKDFAFFYEKDLCDTTLDLQEKFDIIVSFEVIEHIGKNNINYFLQNIYKHCDENTLIFLSTPCYDEQVGAAENHIIDGVVGELTYLEMKESLKNNNFNIINSYGTFASIKDYKDKLNDWQEKFYLFAKEYFDSNILSNLMAPMFPEYSRNVLWECKIK